MFDRIIWLWLLISGATGSLVSCCDPTELEHAVPAKCDDPKTKSTAFNFPIKEALLATRFETLDELEQIVDFEYFQGTEDSDGCHNHPAVRVIHCSLDRQVVCVLEEGVDQDDFRDARSGGIWERVQLAWKSPFAVVYNKDLQRIFNLARRRHRIFGGSDVAFFDLAETTFCNITWEYAEKISPSDTTEKGYVNTFNHITAQAFVTSFFSEEMADYLGDVHERENMPSLITGNFSEEDLTNPDNNAVDNYVDLINNEWGQELGKKLKLKYGISHSTEWTPELLAGYLNDIQDYYAWAFELDFIPYRPEDLLIQKFAAKINRVMEELPAMEQPNQDNN